MIDWLIHSLEMIEYEENGIIFDAMNLCSQFISKLDIDKHKKLLNHSIYDYQLTCMSTLIIASKKDDIKGLDLE